MIRKETLKSYLRYFGVPQRERGKSLYLEGAVLNVARDEEKKLISCNVSGGNLYKVQIKYLSESQIASGKCTCPYRSFCKHQAALVEHLINDLLPSSVPALHMEGSTGEFRLLPSDDLKVIWDLLCQITNSYSQRNISYAFELVSRERIHCFKNNSHYHSHDADPDIMANPPEAEIDLSLKHPAIKCNVCNKIISRLCSHTRDALYQLLNLDAFDKYYENIDQYDQIKANFCERMGISASFLSRHCRIFIDEDSYRLIKNDDRLIIGAKWGEFVSSVEDLVSGNSALRSYFLRKKLNEFENNLGDALVWSEERDRSRHFFPMIIEGKLNRERTKISSHIKETGTLQYSTARQINFYYEYEKLISTNKVHDMSALVSRIHAFLDQHFNVFSSFLNYLHQKENNWGYYQKDKLMKKDLKLITFSREKANLLFEVREAEDFYELNVSLKAGSKLVPLKEIGYKHCLFVLIGKHAHLYENPDVYFFIPTIGDREKLYFDKNKTNELAAMLFRLSGLFLMGDLPEALRMETSSLRNGTKKLMIRESGRVLSFEPRLQYDQYEGINILTSYLEIQSNGNGMVGMIPEKQEAGEFIDFMDNSHPSFKESRQGYEYYYLSIEDALKDKWFLHFFEKCRNHNITILGEDLLRNFKFNRNKAVVSSSVSSGVDWFDLHVEMSFGNQKVPAKKWIEALRNGEKYVQLDDGTYGIIPEEWLARLEKIALFFDIQGKNLRISKLSFDIVEELFEELGEDELAGEIRTKKEKLRSFDNIQSHALPGTIKARLRDYQKKGFQWLKFLDEFQFGGCLADDMGLGKTLQVLSFLADQKKLKKGTNLVVVPRSLLFNWAAEIDKFCPSLNYLIYHGLDRNFDSNIISKHDLIISTYDTVTLDIEIISGYEFNYAILDESQAIKNPHSKRYKAMRLLQSANRLAMTGTPIENNTFDLYGQFSFINPGLLGSTTSFKNKFAVPIDKRNDAEAADHLRKLIYPFILRRTKEQVASDLPEKTESILQCEMGPRQRKLYDELKASIRSDLEAAIHADGINKSRFKILEGLLRLRQLCNSPLLLGNQYDVKNAHSAKLEMFLEHIEEVILSHKALVFSQFVSMLKLIRSELDGKKIAYAYLDGSTTDRQASVDKFQNNEDCKVFLISLKAGNTGLNLTSAEYVYLFDPWWNPAVEAQAIDRTHRIGQQNKVFAYKLICRDTIEEKILELQDMKRKVASDIIRTDEHILKSLTKEKLMALFD